MREAAFSPPARAAYNQLSPEDQAEVSRLVSLIEHDPTTNNPLVTDFIRPPLVLKLLDNGLWQIIFYVVDDATVKIHALAPVIDP